MFDVPAIKSALQLRCFVSLVKRLISGRPHAVFGVDDKLVERIRFLARESSRWYETGL